jgi:hypothetical protein
MKEQQERIAERLSTEFAADRLSLDELERRLELVYQARTPEDLAKLTADLPQVTRAALPDATRVAARGRRAVRDPSERVPARRIRALFSGIDRSGPMEVPALLEVRAVFGSVELDLTGATFGAVTEIECHATFGSIEIVLPSDVRVEHDGGALLGSYSCTIPPGNMPMVGTAPVVRLTGHARLGSVEVTAALRPYPIQIDTVRRL